MNIVIRYFVILMLIATFVACASTPKHESAQQEKVTVETVTTETAGTISEVRPDTLVIRTETSSSPISYSSTNTTTYVDDTGAPVSIKTVKSGLPVTVYYTLEGDRMIANKVMIRRTTTTTTTDRGSIEEKQTTTTTTTESK
jgi:hypothetical protein